MTEQIQNRLCTVRGDEKDVLRAASEEVQAAEDERLCHSKGWTREPSIRPPGMPAALPLREEEKEVKTAAGSAHAEQQREQMS